MKLFQLHNRGDLLGHKIIAYPDVLYEDVETVIREDGGVFSVRYEWYSYSDETQGMDIHICTLDDEQMNKLQTWFNEAVENGQVQL